jgi:gluconokinase
MQATGLIVMGVSGCGKTSVGKALAAKLGWEFFDADSYHPPENVAKMASGIPLDDEDRAPWLAALNGLLARTLQSGGHPVLACSALKQSYRDQLVNGNAGLRVVYLKGEYDLIFSRMTARGEHYMKPGMLKSQFDALEEPADSITVEIDQPILKIVDCVLRELRAGERK